MTFIRNETTLFIFNRYYFKVPIKVPTIIITKKTNNSQILTEILIKQKKSLFERALNK